MNRDLTALNGTTFDLAIIGGGINGAATAREAALRGLKVALVEARDFAAGTSSRSSKLIHGGLRYLEQFDFKLVREARRERRLLLKLAPHLAQPVPFLLPIYQGDPYSPFKIRLGLTLYDLFGNLGRKDRHRLLGAREALRLVPAFEPRGLRAAALYHDSETDDARLTLENVLDAAAHGAVVSNYTEVRALAVTSGPGGRAPRVVSAEAEDALTGRRCEISARLWVNAAGPWVDHVRALLPGFDGSKTVRLTQGTHIVVPPLAGAYAVLAAIPPGERVFVMTPWHGQTLLGTTDTDFDGDPAAVRPDRADIEYLLSAANRVFTRQLTSRDVATSFAGLRALALDPSPTGQAAASPSANTREYRFHEDPWAANFITVCGGKLTTARALGEKLVDLVLPRLETRTTAPSKGLSSRTVTLPGGQTGPFEVFLDFASWEAVRQFDIPQAIAERIVRTYGSRWRNVLEPIRDDRRLAEPLPGSPTLLAAEVDFAIRHEMAVSVEDFLLRRSGLNWFACAALREAVPAVARLFAERFAWGSERRRAAVEAFSRCGCPAPGDEPEAMDAE